MKTVTFNHISVTDFKGVVDHDVAFSEGVTVICGPNYSGKTSLLDALYWVLFGKSLIGDTRFGVMPIGCDDAVPSVELVLTVDGEAHTLARRLIDRGSKTDCLIDGAPVKVSDYDAWVSANIMQMDRFKLFSNPMYFASLSWQEQRALFVGFFENMPREDVLNLMQRDGVEVSTEYRLRSEKQKPEDIIEVMKREIKEIDAQKNKDQGAADYLTREIREAGIVDTAALVAERDQLMKQWEQAVEIAKSREAERDKVDDARRALRQLEQEAEDIRFGIRESNRAKETNIARGRQLIADTEAKIQRKAVEWKAAEAKAIPTVCPTCGQDFPADRVDAGEQAKKRVIADIEIEGKSLRDDLAEYRAALDDAQQISFPDAERALAEKVAEVEKQREVVQRLEAAQTASPTPILDLRRRIDDIGVKIAYAGRVKEKAAERDELVRKIQKAVFGIEIRERVKKDAERFIQYRAMATVEAVNNQFDRVKIELYEYPKNGEPKPTFKLLYGGVNYGDTSSTERVLLGLEINDYLKKALDVSVPTIIDNFESYPSIVYDALPKQSIISIATDDEALMVMSK